MRTFVQLGAACALTALACFAAGLAAPPSGAKVYVPSSDRGNVSVISALSRTDVVEPLPVGFDPRWVVPSPDRRFVYVANRNGAQGTNGSPPTKSPVRAAPGTLDAFTPCVSVIDVAADAVVEEIPLDRGGATGLAVTPDGSRLYVTCTFEDAVCVVDTATRTQTARIEGAFASPEAIVSSPDGARIFVHNRGNATVTVVLTATNAVSGTPYDVGFGHRDIGISSNGQRLLLVGDGPAEIVDTTTGANVVTFPDVGSHRHVAVAGNLAIVSNQNHSGANLPAGSNVPPGQGALDVFDLATATYVASIPLSESNPYGVAIAPDGTYAWVSAKDSGGLMSVDLVGRAEDGVTAPIGPGSRNVAVVIPDSQTVVSFFLPTVVNLKTPGGGKDSLATGGLFDDGNLDVDYTQPVTLEVGDFSRTFTLVPNAKGTAYSFRDATLQISLTPNLRGSSRGRFKLKIQKTTLAGLVPLDGPVAIRFQATGLPDMRGTIALENGRYRRARKRGALAYPPFFAGLGQFKLGTGAKDSCIVRWGFSSGDTTPASLGTVRIGIGSLDLTVPGDAFARKGETFVAVVTEGASKVTVSLDYKRELARVVAKNVELGDLRAGEGATFTLDAGGGLGTFQNVIRLGGAGGKLFY